MLNRMEPVGGGRRGRTGGVLPARGEEEVLDLDDLLRLYTSGTVPVRTWLWLTIEESTAR